MSQIKIKTPDNDTPDEWALYIKSLFEDPDNKERKRKSYEVRDYYDDSGKQIAYLEDEMRKIYADSSAKRKWTQPVTKLVVDALAITYSGIVKRDIQSIDTEVRDDLDKLLFKNLNSIMTTANRMLVSQRYCINSTILLTNQGSI